MHPSHIGRTYGWKPQLPDVRDVPFRPRATQSNPRTDLRAGFQDPYDQLTLGSCTANAIAGVIAYDLARQKLPVFTPSRLFIYYNERDMEGTIPEDAGAAIRDGIKTINSLGVCPEILWPYNVDQFATPPPAPCFAEALAARSVKYEAVAQDLGTIRGCLTQGTPVVIGFTVYDSFESEAVAKTGLVPMPDPAENVLGGHAVDLVGANDTGSAWNGIPPQSFVMRNSWGPDWGIAGYFFLPFAYLLDSDLAGDFWAIEVMA